MFPLLKIFAFVKPFIGGAFKQGNRVDVQVDKLSTPGELAHYKTQRYRVVFKFLRWLVPIVALLVVVLAFSMGWIPAGAIDDFRQLILAT